MSLGHCCPFVCKNLYFDSVMSSSLGTFSPEKLGWDFEGRKLTNIISVQEDLSYFVFGHWPENFNLKLVFTQQLHGNK